MLAKLAGPALLAAALFLSIPTAHAKVCYGPWVEVARRGPGVSWGKESSCSCGSIRGGALVSTEKYGLVWSQGKGVAALMLEYYWLEGDVRRYTEIGASRSRRGGVPFSGANGSGYEGYVYVDDVFSIYYWSYRYRTACDDFT